MLKSVVHAFRKSALAPAIVAATLGVAATAHAADASHAVGVLSFQDPSGVVAGTDVIPVYLVLTLDEMSDALHVNGGVFASGGPSEQELIDAGFNVDAGVSTNLNVFFECSGTFTNVCSPGPYAFDFDFDGNAAFDVEPGGSLSYLFGHFTPSPSPTPAGTYTFYRAGLFIQAYGTDQNGDDLHVDFSIATACDSRTADCAFTRTVEAGAIPEPATWLSMILGFGAAGAVLRRRDRPATA